MDKFQKRYLDHQFRKKRMIEHFEGGEKTFYGIEVQGDIFNVLTNRRSQRHFTNQPVADNEIEYILEAIRISPSSCNRQAITVRIYRTVQDKDKIQELLVGGVSWIAGADIIMLLFADPIAYKSPNEKEFMHWLDAGVCVQSVYIACEVLGLGCCFVNPNIRPEDRDEFHHNYNPKDRIFCGALAIGNYNKKAKCPPKRSINEIRYK